MEKIKWHGQSAVGPLLNCDQFAFLTRVRRIHLDVSVLPTLPVLPFRIFLCDPFFELLVNVKACITAKTNYRIFLTFNKIFKNSNQYIWILFFVSLSTITLWTFNILLWNWLKLLASLLNFLLYFGKWTETFQGPLPYKLSRPCITVTLTLPLLHKLLVTISKIESHQKLWSHKRNGGGLFTLSVLSAFG